MPQKIKINIYFGGSLDKIFDANSSSLITLPIFMLPFSTSEFFCVAKIPTMFYLSTIK